MLRSIEWQQQTIAENEERFHGAIHEAPIPIMVTGEGGEVVELNRARQDITAFTMDEVRTITSWSSLAWNEEDAALPEAGISRLLASRANRFERKYKLGDSYEVIPPNYTLRQSSLI
jgi:PAS domain S-box-containing protein